MKNKVLPILTSISLSITISMAQAPSKMSYQAVIRNPRNDLVSNLPVKMRISILQGSPTGNVVFTEIHNPTTNAYGLVNIEIGAGISQTGSFASINWGAGNCYLKTETDPANGSNYSIVGTSQLLSVPFAQYSNQVNIRKNGDTISLGDLQLLIPGVKIYVSGVPAVIINGQVWMNKNLEVNTYRNGDNIPEVKDKTLWASLKTGAWCHFANDITIGQSYGKLYNWHAVTDPRGLCPQGWRIPTKSDYEILIRNLGGDTLSAMKLRETGTAYWVTNIGTNTTQFSARAGSWRSQDGTFYYWVRDLGGWWTNSMGPGSSYIDINNPWLLFIEQDRASVGRNPYWEKNAGASVRCIKE